ncbi:hypothetical protein ES702_05190 [subsurface metagenome]
MAAASTGLFDKKAAAKFARGQPLLAQGLIVQHPQKASGVVPVQV